MEIVVVAAQTIRLIRLLANQRSDLQVSKRANKRDFRRMPWSSENIHFSSLLAWSLAHFHNIVFLVSSFTFRGVVQVYSFWFEWSSDVYVYQL